MHHSQEFSQNHISDGQQDGKEYKCSSVYVTICKKQSQSMSNTDDYMHSQHLREAPVSYCKFSTVQNQNFQTCLYE